MYQLHTRKAEELLLGKHHHLVHDNRDNRYNITKRELYDIQKRDADRVATLYIEQYCATIPKKNSWISETNLRHDDLGTFQRCWYPSGPCIRCRDKVSASRFVAKWNVLLRVRDCHVEVLAKRAFRRKLYEELQRDIIQFSGTSSNNKNTSNDIRSILERIETPIPDKSEDTSERSPTLQCRLKDGVTVHMYCSSTPCGNATLKKFAKILHYIQWRWRSFDWFVQLHSVRKKRYFTIRSVAFVPKDGFMDAVTEGNVIVGVYCDNGSLNIINYNATFMGVVVCGGNCWTCIILKQQLFLS